jgi:hypothetical protein
VLKQIPIAGKHVHRGNTKYLLVHAPAHFPDVACGLQNVATGEHAVPYVVATTQPSALGFSLGLIHPSAAGGGN